jgi:hypothetical protein
MDACIANWSCWGSCFTAWPGRKALFVFMIMYTIVVHLSLSSRAPFSGDFEVCIYEAAASAASTMSLSVTRTVFSHGGCANEVRKDGIVATHHGVDKLQLYLSSRSGSILLESSLESAPGLRVQKSKQTPGLRVIRTPTTSIKQLIKQLSASERVINKKEQVNLLKLQRMKPPGTG